MSLPTLERVDVNGYAATPAADLELMARTLAELRQRATLLDLLCRALAPLAYAWATLVLVSAAWGVTLAFPTIARMVAASLFSITVGVYALMVSWRKGKA